MGWTGKDVSVVYPPYVSVTPFEEEKYKLLMIGSVRLRDIVLPSPVNHAIISRPVVALVDCQTPVQLRAAGELVRSFSPAQQPFSPCKSDQSLGVCAEGRGRRGLGEEQKDSKSRLLLPSLKILTWIWMDEVLWYPSMVSLGQRWRPEVRSGWWLWCSGGEVAGAGRAAVHRQVLCIILLVPALDAPLRYGETHCPGTSEDFFFQSLCIASGATKLQYSFCNIKRHF